jgi:DNA-binding response OmpR family regulator
MNARNLPSRDTALLVTDDPDLQAEMAAVLEAMGCEIVVAIDHRSAVARIRESAPQLICVDLALPRDSGFDLCEFVRSDPSRVSVQILVISDRDTPEDMADAEEAGANAFLRKPFSMHVLERYVAAMRGRRPSSQTTIRALAPSTYPPPR